MSKEHRYFLVTGGKVKKVYSNWKALRKRPAILFKSNANLVSLSQMATEAYEMADAMLKAREGR